MTVKLTATGQTVTLKEVISHRAETAFWDRVREVQLALQQDTITVLVYKRAIEHLLSFLIETIANKEGEVIPFSTDWPGDLPESDYLKLESAVMQIRERYENKKAEGEKKS
jgi:hypothetical protein